MIVHMVGLYTRLVTYVRLYILTLVVSFYYDISYISFIVLFLILIIPLYFISVYHVVIAYIIFIHESSFPYTHIHPLGRFWRPWIRTSRILDTFLYCSGVCWARTLREELEFSLFYSGILNSFYSCFRTFSWFMYFRFSFYSSSFYMISCVDAYMWYCSDRCFIMI